MYVFVRLPLIIRLGWTPVGVALFLLVFFSQPNAARAAILTIKCDKEATGIPGWDGPLTITYDGDVKGVLTVKSAHIELSLPATKSTRASNNGSEDVTATVIVGIGETDAPMPELPALEVCVASSLSPEFKDDPDMYYVGALGCLPKVPHGSNPVRINATMSVGIIPGAQGSPPNIIVELKRSYVARSSAPGGKIVIDTFPGDCK